MYELYEANKLLHVGTIKEISNYIAYSVGTIRSCLCRGQLVGGRYHLKRVGNIDRHRKRYDVYQNGVLVAENLDIREVSKTYIVSEPYIRNIARLERPTKDGLLFKER